MQHSINTSSAAISFLDQEVISLQDKQSKLSASAENLYNTVLSTTTSTSRELQKINDTLYSIGSTLDSSSYGDYWPLVEDIVYRILSYIWLGFYRSFLTEDLINLDQGARWNRVKCATAKYPE
jgi:hypothetical protein